MNNTPKNTPTLQHPENLEAIRLQKESGDFAPADQQDQFPGYPEYPDSEDAFVAAEIISLDAGNSLNNAQERNPDAWNETSDLTGEDLDVPGSELDDADEAIGKEDEENNYYSLGGDNHEDN